MARPPLDDAVRRATNHVFFCTLGPCTSFSITLERQFERQAKLYGNVEEMLKGLLENKAKFDELGVDVLGKKNEDHLIVHIRKRTAAK